MQHLRMNMRFTFSNLGPIDNAQLELAKLTVICGRNNTGKTYVTYSVYAFLASWRQLLAWEVDAAHLRTLATEGTVSIDLKTQFAAHWREIQKATSKRWNDYLPSALGAPSARFKETEVNFELTLDDKWIAADYKNDFRTEQGKVLFTAEKAKGSSVVQFGALKDDASKQFPSFALEDFVSQALLEAVLGPYLPPVFMVSTERTGAVIFKEELNLTKNKIVNLLATMDASKRDLHPGQLFEAIYKAGYPLPVEKNVQFVNRFVSLENQSSALLAKHPELIDDFASIAGGKYETSKDGAATHFVPKGSKTKLRLGEASSAVRSLVVLWYWLKAQADVGDLLLIDEPELNLHPENQRAFARFLVKLVNIGVKVFITTHSDTMLREFNTLIMLARDLPHTAQVRQQFGYAPDEQLAPSDIALYVANGKPISSTTGKAKRGSSATLVRIQADEKLGLDAKIFDDTIVEMGKVQDALRYGVV
jgi:AAA ATPase domain